MKINCEIHVDTRGYEVSHIYKDMSRTPNPAHPSKHVIQQVTPRNTAKRHNPGQITPTKIQLIPCQPT